MNLLKKKKKKMMVLFFESKLWCRPSTWFHDASDQVLLHQNFTMRDCSAIFNVDGIQ